MIVGIFTLNCTTTRVLYPISQELNNKLLHQNRSQTNQNSLIKIPQGCTIIFENLPFPNKGEITMANTFDLTWFHGYVPAKNEWSQATSQTLQNHEATTYNKLSRNSNSSVVSFNISNIIKIIGLLLDYSFTNRFQAIINTKEFWMTMCANYIIEKKSRRKKINSIISSLEWRTNHQMKADPVQRTMYNNTDIPNADFVKY